MTKLLSSYANDEMNADYKEITVRVEQELNIREISILKHIFDKFPEKEMTFDISNKVFTLFLNSVDFEMLKTTIEKVKSDNASNLLISLLNNTVTEIEAIKSYGLKGKKRIYIDYDRERKVKCLTLCSRVFIN